MYHLISFSPHFIVHCSFFFSSAHIPFHLFHVPQFISFKFTLFGCIHITWSFNHVVSFTFQPIPSFEINDLRVSLDKFLILDRYSLLEAEIQWFYYSLSIYIKQEIQYTEIKEASNKRKENSAREIARYTHLLFKLPAPVELAATESMIFKEKIKKNVYLISYLT